jgi:AcrR family transcriptional regulator
MAMGRPRSFDMDTALDEAMEVFWRHGYDGASIAELTKAMGINPPSLYAAFGNKEGLLRAALDRYTSRHGQHMGWVLQGATAHEVAERFLMSTAESHTEPGKPPGCLLVQGGLVCGIGSQNVPFEFATRRAQVESDLRSRFEHAKAEGDLPADADAGALASFLGCVTSGMGIMASAGADRDALRRVALVAISAFPEAERS